MFHFRIFDPKIKPILDNMHRYLMQKGFPYRSVSVIYGGLTGSFCCYFSHDVKDRVTQDVINVVKGKSSEWYTEYEFEYIINKPSNG